MAKPFTFRAEVTNGMEHRSYFERDDKGLHYYSSNMTPLAISNIAGDEAALLRFALLDAKNDGHVRDALRVHTARYAKTFKVLP
jgi:hypothetical protein